MMGTDMWPRALGGGPLTGDSAVRYVFVDEAGTSETEPITIVVGIIAHADHHVMTAEALLAEILGGVPPKFREGFTFHSTEVWNSPKYRDDWRMTDRLTLLGDVMRIPRRLGMAISLGMVRRNSSYELSKNTLTKAQFQHVMAFRGCLGKADKYIREYADPREVATVIAEDVPDMRKHLRALPKLSRNPDLSMGLSVRGALRSTIDDEVRGYVGQDSDILRITRIRNVVHFVEKDEEPLLQIADACAFGLRRYFSELDHGPELAHAILGGLPPLADYVGASSYVSWFFHPSKRPFENPLKVVLVRDSSFGCGPQRRVAGWPKSRKRRSATRRI
jgi:Protein of unknown function (DUF3800)